MKRKVISVDQYVFPFAEEIDEPSLRCAPITTVSMGHSPSKKRNGVKLKDAGIIYAIGMEGGPYVKIGKTTGSAEKRILGLQCGHPARLYVIASVAVEQNLSRIEARIHRFLADHRQFGEWFAVEMGQQDLERLVLQAVQQIEKAAIVAAQPLQVAARTLSNLGASKGGKSRSEKLTPEERRSIARHAAQSRWGTKPHVAEMYERTEREA